MNLTFRIRWLKHICFSQFNISIVILELLFGTTQPKKWLPHLLVEVISQSQKFAQ